MSEPDITTVTIRIETRRDPMEYQGRLIDQFTFTRNGREFKGYPAGTLRMMHFHASEISSGLWLMLHKLDYRADGWDASRFRDADYSVLENEPD
jgi:hypothetical protein